MAIHTQELVPQGRTDTEMGSIVQVTVDEGVSACDPVQRAFVVLKNPLFILFNLFVSNLPA